MIGWCHNCETFQLLRDAPWLVTPYAGGRKPVPCCVVCREEEPWGFGVWDMSEPTSIERTRRLDAATGCRGHVHVRDCAQLHAERQDQLYPGDCDCATREVHQLAMVRLFCALCKAHPVVEQLGCVPGSTAWTAERAGCEHWEQQEEAAHRAIRNASGRSRVEMIRAVHVSWFGRAPA